MKQKNIKNITFVIYDGIKNSVFQSQVLHPLLLLLTKNPHLHITLVSYEIHRPTDEEMTNLIKYQHAYAAAAKLLTIVDEMFATLLQVR